MSDYFPEEIIHKILLKLPVKSLIKLTLVCKSWMSLIKSSAFIQSHLRTTISSNDQNDSHLLLLSAFSQHHWLHWDSPELSEHSMLPNPVIFLENKPVSDLLVVGTCNGLVLLLHETSNGDFLPVTIWNPSIRKVAKPPGWSTDDNRYTTHGFGYDDHSNDYKILRIVTDVHEGSDWSPGTTISVQIYSLARGSWKSLSDLVIPVDFEGGSGFPVFLNGTIHMLETGRNERYICTFILETEEFGEMMRSEAFQQDDECSISRYGDSLAMIKHVTYEFRYMGCAIWVMKQYGVAESWTKLFHISVPHASIHGFRRCGEVVLQRRIGDNSDPDRYILMSFDPKNNQCLVFRTGNRSYYLMDSFVESLVLLDHCNAISYQVARTE